MDLRENQVESTMDARQQTKASSPEQALLAFFQSTYEAGATLGQWDREALERRVR